jgi:hypothetical protein
MDTAMLFEIKRLDVKVDYSPTLVLKLSVSGVIPLLPIHLYVVNIENFIILVSLSMIRGSPHR